MKKIAVFPGSFDPITIGHVEIIKRALPLFDELYVAIGVNSQKKYLFSLKQRTAWLESVFAKEAKINVTHYSGLTTIFCKSVGAKYIVRGLRNSSDFNYEKTIAQLNKVIGNGIETILFNSAPEHSHISSTIVREIIKNNGDVSPFVPPEIKIKRP